MKSLLLSLFTVLSLCSTPIFANECEQRLGVGFAALAVKAYKQEVLTLEQLHTLAQAERPFNPLLNVTPGSKNSAFARAFAANIDLNSEAWAAEKTKLQEFVGASTENIQRSEAAHLATAKIAAPILKESYPSRQTKWFEFAGHAYLALEIDGYVQLREIGNPNPLWTSKTPSQSDDEFYFVWANGNYALAVYHERKLGWWEKIVAFEASLFTGTLVSLPSLSESSHELWVKSGGLISDSMPYTDANEIHNVSATIASTPFNIGIGPTKIKLSTPGRRPMDFRPKCIKSSVFSMKLIRRSDGEFVFAYICTNGEISAYLPLKSKEPFFKGFHKMNSAQGWVRYFDIFEEDGAIYIVTERHLEPGKIWDTRITDEPIGSFDFHGADSAEKQILRGADGQLYWAMTTLNGEPKTSIFSVFTTPDLE